MILHLSPCHQFIAAFVGQWPNQQRNQHQLAQNDCNQLYVGDKLSFVLFPFNKIILFTLGATNSTLQELKTNKSSGVFTYEDTDDFQSVTSNRHIAW